MKGGCHSCDSPFPNLLRIYFVFKYASIPFAAAFPAPIARMTVAAPVTASPPANTPLLDVAPFSSSATIHFLRFVSSPFVVEEISGFGDTSHLYAGGESPAFSGRFCETYACDEERHD